MWPFSCQKGNALTGRGSRRASPTVTARRADPPPHRVRHRNGNFGSAGIRGHGDQRLDILTAFPGTRRSGKSWFAAGCGSLGLMWSGVTAGNPGARRVGAAGTLLRECCFL